MTVAAGRRAAWEVLCAYLVAGDSGRLGTSKRPFPPPRLSARDRAAAKSLAEGTVRRRVTLDAVIAKLAKGRRPRPLGLRAALMLGAYQLLFDPRAPAHSVVHDAVELARVAAKQGGANFVNAILRRLADARALDQHLPPPDATDAEALAIYYSYPTCLVTRWLEERGPTATHALLLAGNEAPPLTLRTNPLRTNRDELAAGLANEGIVTVVGFHPASLIVVETAQTSPLDTEAFRLGLFSVQDSTQTEVVDLLDLAPGQRVLDFCAAPGGKATAIAEAIGDRGAVLAFDTNSQRLARLGPEIERLGLTSIAPLHARDRLEHELQRSPVDRVLVDAPCSNSGVFAQRSEARWRFSEHSLRRLAETQIKILADACSLLRGPGRVVYATCSIEREENEAVVHAVLSSLGDSWQMLSSERILPELGARSGGGVAVLIRRS